MTGRDDDGDEIIGPDGDPIEVDAYLQQGIIGARSSLELVVDRETYVSDWLLVLPLGTKIDGRSEVTFGDVTYEVFGAPERVWNPRLGVEDHVEAHLRLTEG